MPRGLYLLALVAFVTVAVIGSQFPLVEYDTLVRYAPMAEAFAEGNWHDAFHIRFGILSPALSGLLCLVLRVDGLTACIVLASLGWALCVIPVFQIAKSVFDERTAWMAVVLYLICPLTLQYAFKGLREPIRMLGVLMMTAGVFQSLDGRGRRYAGLLNAGVGGALLCLIKVDTVLFAAILGAFFAGANRFRRETWLLFAVLLLVVQIPCSHVMSECGWWVPSIQVKTVIEKVLSP